jgi:hypothetical protein
MPSSYIISGLGSAGARNNNKGGNGYNAAKGGLTSY